MKKYYDSQGVKSMHHIFSKIQQTLKINTHQTRHAKLFDMLKAIENVNALLNEAWKVGKLHNLPADYMNQEFIKIAKDFNALKDKLKSSYLDKKH